MERKAVWLNREWQVVLQKASEKLVSIGSTQAETFREEQPTAGVVDGGEGGQGTGILFSHQSQPLNI